MKIAFDIDGAVVDTVARVRVSGSVVKGVGVCEYFTTMDEAVTRQNEIVASAPGALLDIEEVKCVLDEDGEVLAEFEQ